MSTAEAWPAPAKINRFLHVTGRREDGYHELQTLFQFVDRADTLSFTLRDDDRIRRTSALDGVAPEADLVVRAASALRNHAGVSNGVDIAVDKCLPLGGGLGGGSSNAATTLVALNALWGLELPVDELARLGLALGADVPVFVRGVAAFAEGVGERLTPLELPESALVVVTPDCAVSTARVFADEDLTRHTPRLKMHALSLDRTHNDCEPVTRRLYPEVGAALDWLAAFAPVRMSGTGASVFAMFDEPSRAADVVALVPAGWRAFAGRTLNRSPLLDRLDRWRRAAG